MINLNKNLFKKIYKIRKIETKISHQYKDQEMRCPVHLSIGQEAVAAGVCQALKKEDKILSSHRSHAHYIAKGGNINSMMAELYGKETGCAKGLGGSMHLQDKKAGVIAAVPIVGSTIPIGVGVALKSISNINKKKFITAIFFGEGATEEGIFHESINFAVVNNLPVLFVCENNFFSVYTPLKDRQSKKRNIINIIKSNGMSAFSGDGNDATKVYKIAKKSINYIRKYNKPVFLEFKTYRWLEHCGPNWDDNLGYREKSEINKWIKKCPLKSIEKKLVKDNLNKIKNEIDNQVLKAFKFARKSNFPKVKILKKYN
ncbi:MAG: thiamine pyrophosphate-dependent dehydrogenase E1 component subunit alpha [Pelagibacteraceae bacterium TMED124]|nr:MAG: thiamine pyrophosphate-dependent dehydrogenase E1 component subunit alpha [Pelagibacteraceae bacterium TMED124]|tara:strand:+ start:834 stop:1778 length:945 start_codon:yes stop_codon:yes gene_type:complete